MKRITPFLWFDSNAEEAVRFYTSVFKNSSINGQAVYNEASAKISGQKEGTTMTIPFELDGQPFIALNGGPVFRFNPAISFFVACKDQKEVDHYWEKLGEGGKPGQCGWLEDKFGISWQIVPEDLGKFLSSPDKEKVKKVTEAMLKMHKLDIEILRAAFLG